MSNPLIRHVVIDAHGDLHDAYYWWCPGCEAFDPRRSGAGTHMFHIPPWTFDGNFDAPTFEASYLSYGWEAPPEAAARGIKGAPRCHSFVRLGRIQYLGDSEHPLAGQTVDMVPLPDWLCTDGRDK